MAKKKSAAPWGNRIVGTGTVEAGQLLANEANWRIHPGDQQQALDEVLTEVGFVQAVVVNKRTAASWGKDRHVQTLVDGHLRVSLALARGEDTPVPVVYVDLDPDEERVILATFDPLGAMAGRDRAKLDDLIRDLDTHVDLDAILKGRTKKTVVFDAAEPALAVLVECETAERQSDLLDHLRAEGWVCRPTTA